jgi:hypothetical protein
LNKALALKEIFDTIHFEGHPNILGTHHNTIEVTRVSEITKRADCIIGVKASKGCSDLSNDLRSHILNGGNVAITVEVGEFNYSFTGKGSPELPLTNPEEIVFRRSDFVSDRTAAVACSAGARDIPRAIISSLKEKGSTGTLKIRAVAHSKISEPEIYYIRE